MRSIWWRTIDPGKVHSCWVYHVWNCSNGLRRQCRCGLSHLSAHTDSHHCHPGLSTSRCRTCHHRQLMCTDIQSYSNTVMVYS